jgi:hypothetical protein
LQGIVHSEPCELLKVSAEQVLKWDKGNELWAIVLIESSTKSSPLLNNYIHNGIPDQIKDLILTYGSIFEEPKDLPPSRQYDHSISLLPNVAPINCRPYRYSPEQNDEIERQVTKMLEAGIVVSSLSPFASPMLLVKKKDNSWRFCVDYRKLNSISVKNKFPLPIIDELHDEIAGAKFLSTIDLASGFHQIKMVPEDEAKTAFKTHHGHFQFRVMTFDLTNAPGTFQYLMNVIFGKYKRRFILVFMDDILVFSKTLEEHIEHLHIIFPTLLEHKLYIKFSKCTFAQQQLSYLGHIISQHGVSTDPNMTAAMVNWPTPLNFTKLGGFLGLTWYYRKFVRNYGSMVRPLTNLLHHKKFSWDQSAQRAFEQLKEAMTTTPVLAFPDFTKEFVIETDACETGIGAVLSQESHPIAYFSKGLSAANQKLSTHEKEFLAVVMVVDKWRCYIHKNPFLIKTDHQSICYL